LAELRRTRKKGRATGKIPEVEGENRETKLKKSCGKAGAGRGLGFCLRSSKIEKKG